MAKASSDFIDLLGGTSAVAKLIHAPISTVHSWREIGIPVSRLAHLRLIAQAENKPCPDEAVIAAERDEIAAARKSTPRSEAAAA